MFLVRSAFWLTLAFIAIHPKDVDLGATASALSGQAMAAGQKLVVAQILNNDCSLVGCPAIAKTAAAPLTASVTTPSVGLSMQGSSAVRPVPFPRPRPDWMG
jgi:hypothetical protein